MSEAVADDSLAPEERETLGALVHWSSLGAAEEALYRDTNGECGNLAYAAMCRRTARALELSLSTGKPHCGCCLSPNNWHGAMR